MHGGGPGEWRATVDNRKKQDVITFKADETLSHAMRGIENRSAFIRDAILSALENGCPLCGGTGTLSPDQRRHWETFAANHSVQECDRCHALHLECSRGQGDAPAKGARTKGGG